MITFPTTFQSFNFRQIPGLQFWHAMDDPSANGTVFSNGTAFSTLVDKGPLGNNLVQASGANQLVNFTNMINGLPIAQSNGSNSFMTSANGIANITTNMTYFLVASFPNGTQQSAIISDSAAAASPRITLAFPYTAGSPFYIIDFGNTGAGRLSGAWTQSYATYYVFTIRVSTTANSMEIYANGTLIYSKSGTATFTPAGLSMMFCRFGSFAQYLQTNFVEHVMYNTALSAAQIAQVVSFLRSKYAI